MSRVLLGGFIIVTLSLTSGCFMTRDPSGYREMPGSNSSSRSVYWNDGDGESWISVTSPPGGGDDQDWRDWWQHER